MALKWTYRPASRAPGKQVVIALAALMAAVAGFVTYGPLVGLVGFAIVIGATAEFWLGVHCEVNEKQVSARVALSLSSMNWDEVQSVIVSERSIRVSPLREQTRLAEFRGVELRFFPEDRGNVLDAVRRYCKEDVRFLGQGDDGGGDRGGDPPGGGSNPKAEAGSSGDPVP